MNSTSITITTTTTTTTTNNNNNNINDKANIYMINTTNNGVSRWFAIPHPDSEA